MQIQLKLMGTLRNKLPPGTQGGQLPLEVAPGTTVAGALEQLGITSGQVHLVLVNGAMTKDRTGPVAEGDELTIFPPVAGG